VHPSHNPPPSRLLPLGALAAGFGLLAAPALAQTTPPPAKPESTLQPISVKAKEETDANSVRALTSTIGKGEQDLRDIPQSVTVITEKLLDDRRVTTLKEALHQTGGVTFLAAEGGEEDVRLRGFSLATSGDIYVDGLRDPAFYERDTFSYDRVELLRGSASMLFGRGSTGGVVNQVNKQAFLNDAHELSLTVGSGQYARLTGDFNVKTGEASGLRINAMRTLADQWGNFLDKKGLAVNYRWGAGTNDEFALTGYALRNHNGINYGLPWLRVTSTQTNANPSVMIPGLDPKVHYAAASDYNDGGSTHGTFVWTHRFSSDSQIRTTVRRGNYDRDQRAGTIRFCVDPACPGLTPPSLEGPTVVTPATPLTRGAQNKIQELDTAYAQVDYSGAFNWFGRRNELLAGLDLAKEEFAGFAAVLPTGVTLDKNAPRTTIGTPNDGGGWVDETLRQKRQQSAFDSQTVAVYAQDMVHVTESWKVVAGLRYDKVDGSYQSYQAAGPTPQNPAPPPVGTLTADRARSDGLWSKRFGVLYQPSETQSYHFSYGTSFNTSGDTYQYDAPGSNTPPEASRNLELGAKLELFGGRLSTRVSAFHVTKYNERNRDSPTGEALEQYLLSGKRHAAGIDIDIAGRITPAWEVFGSYAWIPEAEIDVGSVPNANGGTNAISGERQGSRPSLTPRHSGTLWSTYQFTPTVRAGAGVNMRSSQTPNRNPEGIVAPRWTTGDVMVEYTPTDQIAVKLNVLNVTNKYYADVLYTGHYVQGAPRTVQLTGTVKF
jgi:catecholate siderophore receptor